MGVCAAHIYCIRLEGLAVCCVEFKIRIRLVYKKTPNR